MQIGRFVFTAFIFLIAVVQAHPQSRPATYSEAIYGNLIYGLFVPENYDQSKQADINYPSIAKGSFHIVAVNYCFEKSNPSNAVEFKK